jgi:hypothetical protein
MVLYVGYPVSYVTACNLLHVYSDTSNLEMMIENIGLIFRKTDANQYILGLEVTDVLNTRSNLVSVDEALIVIQETKQKLLDIIQAGHIDISDFAIETVGGDQKRVRYPKPFLIAVKNMIAS